MIILEDLVLALAISIIIDILMNNLIKEFKNLSKKQNALIVIIATVMIFLILTST